MPKFLKRLIRTIIILVVIFVILPVALAFIFLFDTKKMNVTYDDNFDQQKWGKALVVDSLDNTETNKYVSFSISESDINNFIHNAIKDYDELNEYMSQLALDITDDSYNLYASGKVYMFETRATLTASLSKGEYKGETAYIFSFDKLTLGRITKLKEVIMFFLTKFMSNATLDDLAQALNIHFDLDNSKAYIYASDLRDLLKASVLGDSGMTEFYFTFINDFLDHNLVDIDFYGNESLSVRINLQRLTGNDYGEGQYVAYTMPYDETTTYLIVNGVNQKLSLNVIRDAVAYLMDQNLITSDNMHEVSQYLFDGYKADNGGNAPACDLSSIGIDNKYSYTGFNLASFDSLDEFMSSYISTFDGYDPSLNSFDLFELDELGINAYLQSQSALGHKYFLHRDYEQDGVTRNKINYIAIDNVYINLTNSSSVISVGLNINGLETWLTLELALDQNNNDSRKLVYNVTSIYYGNKSEGLFVDAETEKLIYDTLGGAIKEGSFSFENGKLTIGFDSLINQAINNINTGNATYDNAYRNFLRNEADIAISVQGNAIEDDASIKIQAVRR